MLGHPLCSAGREQLVRVLRRLDETIRLGALGWWDVEIFIFLKFKSPCLPRLKSVDMRGILNQRGPTFTYWWPWHAAGRRQAVISAYMICRVVFSLIKQKVWETKESNGKNSPVWWPLTCDWMKYFLTWVKTEANNFAVLLIFIKKNFCLGAAVGLLCCTQDSSSCGQRGLLSSCDVWASRCSSFSCCGAWTPEPWRNSCRAWA